MPRPQPGSGQTRLPQNQRSQHMRKQTLGTQLPRQRSSRNIRATTWSLRTQAPNIPDLHEVGEEQAGVKTRDNEQPCEKQRLTIGTATSDLHKVGPTSRTTLHLGHAMRSGNYTLRCHHRRHQGTVY
ncbi:hypothetical protein Taro_015567 [Colocasia esculenta]|uniref:Uncharacterized protein n=1 Tax=Colocasia esculenta TaxID=4460 RepID=A0A843UBQ8_COLES|nr:hypothetical protein [Colocasia esculenta]